MLIQAIAVEYLRYLKYDRNFKDMNKRHERIGRVVMFWLDKHIEELTLNDVTDFKKWMLERKWSLSYTNTFLFLIRSLLRFANDQGIITIEPEKIKPFRIPYKVIDYLEKKEISELLNHFEGSKLYDYRNRAICALILDSGMRIGECLSLRRNQLDEILEGKTKIIGKFGKERPAMFSWSREYLKEYMSKRTDDSEWMFITHCYDLRWQTKQLNQDGFRHYLREYSEFSGKRITPHTLRRTAVTNWFANGMVLKDVSLLAGHETVVTTEKFYLGTDWKKIQASHSEHSFI
jgi:integrase/recombinase XerD